MTVMSEALKRGLTALAAETSTMKAVAMLGLTHDTQTLDRLAQLMVAPAPADKGHRVEIGRKAYDLTTQPKRYPPLTIALKGGVVRGLGIGLGRLRHTTRTGQKLSFRLLQIIDSELKRTETRTGKRYPGEGHKYLWDDEIGEIEITLSDFEMSIFSDLFLDAFTSRNLGGSRSQGDAPYLDDLYQINGAIRDHIVAHGGYDHGKHVDNIFRMDPESTILDHYIRTGETL